MEKVRGIFIITKNKDEALEAFDKLINEFKNKYNA